MKNTAAVILAAGKGTRMNSELPKVLHEACGLPLVRHVVRQVKKLGIKKIIVVVGYRKDLVSEALKNDGVTIVVQKEQLGTGHAVMASQRALKGFTGDVIVLDGDVFFSDPKILKDFSKYHRTQKYEMSIITEGLDEPYGYGRIIRDRKRNVVAIREELDATRDEKAIKEINAGIYVFKGERLFTSLRKIKKNPKKKEYYLTDIVEVYRAANRRIGGYCIDEDTPILGVNDRVQLADVQKLLQKEILHDHMRKGVTVIDPASTYIEVDVTIGADTIIYPYTYIEKDVRIGKQCCIGPFCKMRSRTSIAAQSNIGSFVEVVRSKVGSKTNIKHLSYIGDAVIGNHVNVGAGTITANYDGKRKHKTTIGDDAFIGSNSVLIAPNKIGKGARTGAGAVLPRNKNVPKGKIALGIPARIVKK